MKKERTKGKVMWGFLYAAAFIAAFAASAIFKMTYHPLAEETRVDWSDAVGRIYTDLPYGEGPANRFDLYVPADNTREAYGLVVYLHAGGFTSGAEADDAGMLKWLCSKGYVAAGVNYTLFREDHLEASVYSQSQEIKSSIPAIQAAAAELGYNLDRMAVSGGSAGGCLALLFAYRDAADSPIPVKMVFEAVGPASFHHEDWTPYGLDRGTAESDAAAAGLFSTMAGTVITPEMVAANDYQDAVRGISAYQWVTADSVPTLCAYGAYDRICPFRSVRHLIAALEENGVPFDYIEFPHSGHGLQNDDRQARLYQEKIIEYLETYLPV